MYDFIVLMGKCTQFACTLCCYGCSNRIYYKIYTDGVQKELLLQILVEILYCVLKGIEI